MREQVRDKSNFFIDNLSLVSDWIRYLDSPNGVNKLLQEIIIVAAEVLEEE